MRLIDVKAFLERESFIRDGEQVDRRAKVLESRDDEATAYAILSHRWTAQEVDYKEMIKLVKMDGEEKDEIRQRDGYQKILQSCEQAQKDGYEWLWVDTCCIDKRSSAELSEAINSMYRWYENAQVCYAYLHDVPDSSFPTARDDESHPDFKGWPEWFTRGWTLQELIAPSNVQFFNKNWQSIGDKRTLAPTLHSITGIPEDILVHGLCGNRPCVAQIMSWAANRTTTRVEDRAYSLMGLLDVHMPMLYGEGKKAFHRLQLEIIRASNDQSIFAWFSNGDEKLTGSILADDPRCFWSCGEMELMGHDEFIGFLDVPEEERDSIKDRLGTFPVTNRGIQIWLPLCPNPDSRSLFEARLPCRRRPWDPPVTIDLVLWESIYQRRPGPQHVFSSAASPWHFRQVYLRYQDPPHRNTTFEIDDSALIENGFTFRDACPKTFTGDTLTLTSINSFCIKVYSDNLTNIVVSLGQSFGKDWIHVVSDESNPPLSWERSALSKYYLGMMLRMPEDAQYLNKARSRVEQVCIMQARLPRTTRILQISSVMWESSRMRGVKLEVFRDPGFGDVSGEWATFDVNGTDDPGCDWRGLMILDWPRKYGSYEIRGVPGNFSPAPDGIKLGDYGRLTDSEEFCCEGNLFADLESFSFTTDITPRQHKLPSMYHVMVTNADFSCLYKPLILSLPSSDALKSLLASLSTRLTDRYLVTRVIRSDFPDSTITSLCDIAKPFIWYRNESAGSASEERSSDELRAGTESAVTRVNDIDEMEL